MSVKQCEHNTLYEEKRKRGSLYRKRKEGEVPCTVSDFAPGRAWREHHDSDLSSDHQRQMTDGSLRRGRQGVLLS